MLGVEGQLGWTTWLGTRDASGSADDVIIDLQRSVQERVRQRPEQGAEAFSDKLHNN